MARDVEVQKIVLLPRHTSFAGARTFLTAPVNVRAFASAMISLWVASGVGTVPAFSMAVEESPDLKIWNGILTFNPTPGTELTQEAAFSREWVRLSITLAGTNPGFTGWCVGNFVTRAPRP